MREQKIVTAAKAAKKEGVRYIASIVKTHRATTYCHVVSCDDVIRAGKWIPAPFNCCGKWLGRMGVSTKKINWSCTLYRQTVLAMIK